jgi:hypothetical protein
MKTRKWLILIGAVIFILLSLAGMGETDTSAAGGNYKILAWNDLGMHCYSRDFQDMAVLPPYNTLWVQVVKAGDPPEVVTSGVKVEYFYQDNTYSVGKTNFWDYDQALFGVDLPANVGLKGKGLSGVMELSGDHFIAEGIPITEFSDSAPTVRQPYQLATVVARDAVTGAELSRIQVVTPTSSEMRCDTCHNDTGIAKPSHVTGKVETNILQLHDEKSGTSLMTSRPVLCAGCHASNALGAPGNPGIDNLSKSMHSKHASIIPSTLDGCYNCHPGPQTRCLRDVMSTEEGMVCVSCHGGMSVVSNNPNPWLQEPRCDSCHNSGLHDQDQPLYRFSKGHGGLYCEACHDSTHAVAPSREGNDALKFIQLQGENGPIEKCAVCHTVIPGDGGPHTITRPLISGNVEVANVTLSYTDNTPRSVVSMPDGSYSIGVSPSWDGTITPSHPCYTFDPPSRSYSNVSTNQIDQNFTAIFNPAAGCTNIDISVHGASQGRYGLPTGTSTRTTFTGLNDGPMTVSSTTGSHLVASQRVLYGGWSYSEMMGLPFEQLSKEYLFPYYNNVAMDSQLRVSNVGGADTTITVYLAGSQIDQYALAAGGATRKNYTGRNSGPLRVTSSASNILATTRVLYGGSSYSELMGLPIEQLAKEYLFPYYNNVAMNSQLRVSNVGGADTTITIYLGKDKIDEYALAAGGSTRKNYTGRNSGPLRVTSSASNILATIRVLYNNNSYSELMGFPANKLEQEYWYPVYDNVALESQLRVSNVGTDVTTITVYAGGTQIDSYTLAAGAATRKTYPKNTGPLHVVSSSQSVLTSIRLLYASSSYYEMTGLPNSQLSTQYFFPWYNNKAMDSELRLAVP